MAVQQDKPSRALDGAALPAIDQVRIKISETLHTRLESIPNRLRKPWVDMIFPESKDAIGFQTVMLSCKRSCTVELCVYEVLLQPDPSSFMKRGRMSLPHQRSPPIKGSSPHNLTMSLSGGIGRVKLEVRPC